MDTYLYRRAVNVISMAEKYGNRSKLADIKYFSSNFKFCYHYRCRSQQIIKLFDR